MTIENMEYDFRQKLNSFASNVNRGFQVPEIDWKLNTALKMLVTKLASPRFQPQVGFEFNQRNIDDLRPLLKRTTQAVAANRISLPTDYLRYVSAYANATKGSCTKRLRVFTPQMDDLWETDPFSQSSFEWEELTALQVAGAMELKPIDFTVSTVDIDYISTHPYIHNAVAVGGYSLPDGTALVGKQDCILSDDMCSEVVDLAVFLTVNDTVYSPDAKTLNLNSRN